MLNQQLSNARVIFRSSYESLAQMRPFLRLWRATEASGEAGLKRYRSLRPKLSDWKRCPKASNKTVRTRCSTASWVLRKRSDSFRLETAATAAADKKVFHDKTTTTLRRRRRHRRRRCSSWRWSRRRQLRHCRQLTFASCSQKSTNTKSFARYCQLVLLVTG